MWAPGCARVCASACELSVIVHAKCVRAVFILYLCVLNRISAHATLLAHCFTHTRTFAHTDEFSTHGSPSFRINKANFSVVAREGRKVPGEPCTRVLSKCFLGLNVRKRSVCVCARMRER